MKFASIPKPAALRAAGLLAVAACATLLFAAASQAEQSQVGNLRGSFNGGISPSKLPRTELAPVTVTMSGKIATTDRTTPPKLERIVLAINKQGRLETKGLPTCSLAKLNSLPSSEAKRVCAGALVGHGNVTSRVSLPGQGAFASNADLLAFNGKLNGHQAVLAQVSSGAPLPLTYVIGFEVTKSKGTFGTTLTATLPPIASEYGYISAFSLALSRRYEAGGKQRSFASASCPAPKGLTRAPFPFAKASYSFADGRILGATLNRDCKVRGN
ncbi:MAG: hypothetical protein ABW065_04550 [Solirubrobacterales bacterium]